MSAQLVVNLQPKQWLPAQAEASVLAEDPKGPEFVLLSGGQGAGKTWWLCWATLRVYFKALSEAYERGESGSQIHGLFLSPTLNLLKKSILPTLEAVLAEAGLEGRYTVNRQEGILRFDWGGCFYFFTAEKPEMVIAVNVVVAAVDEPGTPKNGEALMRVKGRLRGAASRRVCVMAGTPEDIVAREWLYSFIASPEAEGKFGVRGDGSRRVVFARTQDNRFIQDLEGFIRGQRSVLTEAQQEAYLEGRFVAFNKGRVYSGYIDRDHQAGGHLVKAGDPLLIPPVRGVDLLFGLDFNVDPMCGVIGWHVGQDTILIADEIRIPNAGGEGQTPINRWTREAIQRWVDGWSGTLAVYGDATEKRQTVAASTTGWNLVHTALREAIQARGWEYRNGVWGSNPREIDRVNSVNKAFEDRHILVAEGCAWLRKDLNLVGFREGTIEVDKQSDKKLTHLSDALGYLWVQRSGLMPVRKPGEVMPHVLGMEVPTYQRESDWGGGGGGAYDWER